MLRTRLDNGHHFLSHRRAADGAVPCGAVDRDLWGLAYCANGARRALRRGLVVRWLWSLGRFRNRCSATELSGAADVCTVDHLHGEGLSGRAIQAAFAWRHCREHRRQVRAPGARKCFVSTRPAPGNRLTTRDFSPPLGSPHEKPILNTGSDYIVVVFRCAKIPTRK